MAQSPETVTVDVIEATNDIPQYVSLECAIKPGSFPKPVIEWVQSDPEEVVMEDVVLNTVRFVNDGRYLILEITSDVTDKEYYCRATNSEFTAERDPITYTFRTGMYFLHTKYAYLVPRLSCKIQK